MTERQNRGGANGAGGGSAPSSHGSHADPRAPHGGHPPGGATDAELSVKAIVGFGIGLGVVIAVSLALVWLLSARLKAAEVARDPEPSPLAEVNAHRLPPEPRLQSAPVGDMKTLRAHETEVLSGYGNPDRATGTARIPIDRAIDILAATGLPEPHPPAAGAAPPPPAASPAVTAAPGTASGGHGR